MHRNSYRESAIGKTIRIVMLLVFFALPGSRVLAAGSGTSTAYGAFPANAATNQGQIPTWEPPLDPNYSKWENVPVTYDNSSGAVEWGRFPDCKTCPPRETDWHKPDAPVGWPGSATVKIIAHWPSGGTSECSGMLIDQTAVVVAGHCVFTHIPALCVDKNACWISDLQIFQKYQTEDEQESGYTQILTWTAWTKNRDFQYDLAGIKLNQPLGKNAGWLGFGYNNDPQNEFFPTAKFEHTSYPSNPASAIEKWSGYFTSVEDHHFYTDGLSNNGTSGAGAHSNDHFHIIYSVLSHHKIGAPTQTAHTRITPDKFFALHDWINGNIREKNLIFYVPFFTN